MMPDKNSEILKKALREIKEEIDYYALMEDWIHGCNASHNWYLPPHIRNIRKSLKKVEEII